MPLVGFLVAAALMPGDLAYASESACVEDADLNSADAGCKRSAEDVRDLYRSGSSSGFTYRLEPRYHVDPYSSDEYRQVRCEDPPDTFIYELFRAKSDENPLVWEYHGYVCLGSAEEITQQITAEDAAREFRRLSWPAADLAIQPPDGETLVNLPTIFMTTNPEAVTQTITLLGQTLEIEATPVEWIWHWAQPGDGASGDDLVPYTTTQPGAPHPDATVTHAYRLADTTVRPSVDVTYQGRYRVDGGTWEDIPDTRTVTGGAGQTLTILEARPTLMR